MPDLSLERTAGGIVAGVDEAGRGPWAGPVVAAAVVLDTGALPGVLTSGIDDSKKLSAARREELAAVLPAHARIGIGAASTGEIDRLNILSATMLAMQRAIARLGSPPDHVLVDGNRLPALPCPATAVIGGDRCSLSIAAASIIAKVTRDRIMRALATRYPDFGWERNAGYGTARHRDGLGSAGVTPHHRKSYRPIINILSPS